MKLTKRFAVSVGLAAVMAIGLAGSVGASPIPPLYGSAGRCAYSVTEYTDGVWSAATLRVIGMHPPVMYPTEDGNAVGWRFVVKRSVNGGRYVRTYKSPIQKKVGPSNDTANFKVMKVPVNLPSGVDPALVRYRLTLVMFHYNADGSVFQRTTLLMPHYLTLFDGLHDYQGTEFCRGKETQDI